MEKALIPLFGVWLAAAPLLSALNILHSMREKVITGVDREKSKLSLAAEIQYYESLLWNSYIPLLTGYVVFLFLVTCVSIIIPLWNHVTEPILKGISYIVAAQFGVSFVGFLIGGLRDIRLINAVIEERRQIPSSPVSPS